MKSRLQTRTARILLTALTLLTMILIFCFSMETAERSDQTSGGISQAVIPIVYPDYQTYTPERQSSIYEQVQHLVRKTAHFSEYTLLGFLLRLCLESWLGKKRYLIPASWAAGTLYAGTDEIHQLLIDGRSGQWTDVLLDSSGVLTGVLAAALLLFLVRRRKNRRSRSTE